MSDTGRKISDDELIWKEQSRKELLKTPVMRVMETTSISPDGETGNYIVMDARSWCAVVPDLGDDYLMVKQWRHASKSLSIEFPGGVIDDGEEPLEAAKRELLEETGMKADEMIYLGCVSPNPALFSNKMHFFLARGLTGDGKQNLDADEYVNAIRISKKEVHEKMCSPDYPHALMAVALFLAKRYIK